MPGPNGPGLQRKTCPHTLLFRSKTAHQLHQRRALRNAGLDPDDAKVRDAQTVEGYVE